MTDMSIVNNIRAFNLSLSLVCRFVWGLVSVSEFRRLTLFPGSHFSPAHNLSTISTIRERSIQLDWLKDTPWQGKTIRREHFWSEVLSIIFQIFLSLFLSLSWARWKPPGSCWVAALVERMKPSATFATWWCPAKQYDTFISFSHKDAKRR